MEYFDLLEFKKEPFSNSPEPEFLFASPQHNTCLQRLELAVRLRRGLNIVIGAVGTGKTTLCRKLIQNLSLPVANDSLAIETFLLLDPAVANQLSFVKTVASLLGILDISTEDREWQIKEKIKNFLFEQGVQEEKNIVLIIDEGQKIPDDCLEILREFLNYETNNFKLLQIIIFAQPEFNKSLATRENLLDRVNYLYHLPPLSFWQTKAMIEHRISIASQDPVRSPLFTFGGMLAVYTATAGYPRKVVSLCHQVLLMMIIRGKGKAGWFLVRSCINKITGSSFKRATWATLSLLIVAILTMATFFYLKGTTNIDHQTQNQRVLSGINIDRKSLSGNSARNNSGPMLVRMDSAKSDVTIPDYLGTLTITKRMTIWRILENIYGDSRIEIKKRFMEANPQIKNINAVSEGGVVHLPAIPATTHLPKKDIIVVAVENSKDMEALYHSLLKKNGQGNPFSLLFLSYWNKREGKQFAIILNKRFATREEAGEAIRRLPSELTVSARLLSQWDGDTVFFNSRFLQ